MLSELRSQIEYYFDFYRFYAMDKWGTIGPDEYGFILIATCVVGYMYMKSANRK
ncbi:MAG: hypothetical protein JKY95_01085 [Planctomycetaceae bacterium]|nr:hypothetical protein [Planctomycetaceae bacterium]